MNPSIVNRWKRRQLSNLPHHSDPPDTMAPVARQGAGKRAGSRRAPKQRSLPSRSAMLLCLAITVCVVAWGFLAFAAIDFGRAARGGESGSWAFLALACLGAAACLFVAMILVARLLRATGIIVDRTETPHTAQSSAQLSAQPLAQTSTQPSAQLSAQPSARPLGQESAQSSANSSADSWAQPSGPVPSPRSHQVQQPESGNQSGIQPGDQPRISSHLDPNQTTGTGAQRARTESTDTDPMSGDTAKIPKVSGGRYQGKRIAR